MSDPSWIARSRAEAAESTRRLPPAVREAALRSGSRDGLASASRMPYYQSPATGRESGRDGFIRIAWFRPEGGRWIVVLHGRFGSRHFTFPRRGD